MSITLHPFTTLSERLDEFDCIIDARSPSEYADDHLPGAINLPVLDDAQRIEIGTMYVQSSPFEARRKGAALVAVNIARHLTSTLAGMPRTWRPLVYCWRGGERSGAMSHVFSRVGWRVTQLEQGYKGYRNHVLASLDQIEPALQFRVICGPTGSGKSRLLTALADAGHQVLDLERLAAHRGSVLGGWPDASAQPGQRRFESLVWEQLRSFELDRPVFVEAESRKVGNLRVPICLNERLRNSPCVKLETPFDVRVALLIADYDNLIADPSELVARLKLLTALHGRAVVAGWEELIAQARWAELVQTLLQVHYDPAYERSIGRDYPHLANAETVVVSANHAQAFALTAQHLSGLTAMAVA